MSKIRNFEQLLIIKQLYQDAILLTNKGDTFSLSKAVIFLDLSIELTLKAILLNLNPNFLSQFFQSSQMKTAQKQNFDISWHLAWEQSSKELITINKPSLSEESECRNLRNLRNGIQHNGQTPALRDVKRYLTSTKRMLEDAFQKAFDLSFDNLRNWDFVQNEELKLLLNDTETLLTQKKLAFCLLGCIWTRKLLKDAVKSKVSHYPIFEYNLLNLHHQIVERFDNLEVEILFVGMGMSILETRRFLSFNEILSDFQDQQNIRIKVGVFTEDTLDSNISEAKFMLDYLFRLILFIENNQPELLQNIKISIPLSKQEFIK